MNQVPHITIEQARAIWPLMHIQQHHGANMRIDAHNKANEQPLITAEEARKLGVGKAEWFDDAFKQWKLCTPDICNYHSYFKYRAIKQPEPLDLSNIKGVGRNFEIKPEPVEPHAELKGHLKHLEIAGVWVVCNEPTCQIKNLDSGLTETMTREKAKLLQDELGDAVEWTNPFGQKPVNLMFKDLSFDCEGIYTYKRKANPLKQVSWSSVPVGVMVTYRSQLYPMYRSPIMGYPCVITTDGLICQDFLNSDFELASASEQTWLVYIQGVTDLAGLEGFEIELRIVNKAFDDFVTLGFTLWRYNELKHRIVHYRITGLAEGYELK